MDTIEKIALAKAVSDKEYSEASGMLSEGEYDIAVSIRIVGKIRKGSDEVHTKPNSTAILAALKAEIGQEKYDTIVSSIPKLSIPCNGKITAKLEVSILN